MKKLMKNLAKAKLAIQRGSAIGHSLRIIFMNGEKNQGGDLASKIIKQI